jgi:hypothetical protein
MSPARTIALALAGKHKPQRLADGSFLTCCPLRTHGQGRGDHNPSLRLGDGQTRLLVHCFGGCNRLDVLAELRRRGLLDGTTAKREHAPALPPRAGTSDAQARQQGHKAAWIWSQRQPLHGTIAESYLREVRGITYELPPTLGFLPARDDYPPAMIAAFGLVDEPEPGRLAVPQNVEAVHLTRLKPDGSGKIDGSKAKIMLGPVSGKPIVLAPPNDLLGLAITEGIEDALSAAQTGLGAWAAGSADHMPKLANVVPSYIEAVTIFAHFDNSGANAARTLAAALNAREIQTEIEGLP